MIFDTFTLIPYKDRFIELTEMSEGHLYHSNRRVCLKTGMVEPIGILALWRELEHEKINTRPSNHRVCHLFYEAGYSLLGLEQLISTDEPLAVSLIYKSRRSLKKLKSPYPMNFKLEKSISLKSYKSAYQKGREALKRGDCYQFNLTAPFNYRLTSTSPREVDPYRFLSQLWASPGRRGAYANGTYIAALDMMLVSNSPECLFQVEALPDQQNKVKVSSMPIKGTTRSENGKGFLLQSEKDIGELNMITDLVRNDLSRIHRPTAYVESKAKLLKVPGLYHQYSKVSTMVPGDTSVEQLLKALFPGGSITGAPKKRVMELIRKLEAEPRGNYCGSTLIRSGGLLAASINIRAGYYWPSVGQLRLHAGGGITLKSNVEDEYSEMLAKVESVLSALSTKSEGSIKTVLKAPYDGDTLQQTQ